MDLVQHGRGALVVAGIAVAVQDPYPLPPRCDRELLGSPPALLGEDAGGLDRLTGVDPRAE
jgi:hypothetical protein